MADSAKTVKSQWKRKMPGANRENKNSTVKLNNTKWQDVTM